MPLRKAAALLAGEGLLLTGRAGASGLRLAVGQDGVLRRCRDFSRDALEEVPDGEREEAVREMVELAMADSVLGS